MLNCRSLLQAHYLPENRTYQYVGSLLITCQPKACVSVQVNKQKSFQRYEDMQGLTSFPIGPQEVRQIQMAFDKMKWTRSAVLTDLSLEMQSSNMICETTPSRVLNPAEAINLP